MPDRDNIYGDLPQKSNYSPISAKSTNFNEPLTMSSREIAELTGRRHDNVMRDIRAMFEELDADLKFEVSEYTDKTGRKLPEYQLPKRETLILVSGYNVKLRTRIIDRWQELEGGNAQPKAIDYSNPAIMLGVLNHLQSEKLALESKVAELQPAQDTLKRISLADGSLCITNAAKTLQVRPKDLFRFLNAHKWIYRRAGAGHCIGYQKKIQVGYLEHKIAEITHSDGTSKVIRASADNTQGACQTGRVA